MKVYTTDRIRNVVLLGMEARAKPVWLKPWRILAVSQADWEM